MFMITIRLAPDQFREITAGQKETIVLLERQNFLQKRQLQVLIEILKHQSPTVATKMELEFGEPSDTPKPAVTAKP